jgi:pimeloyl-ACP methyl ester carboxylesterase
MKRITQLFGIFSSLCCFISGYSQAPENPPLSDVQQIFPATRLNKNYIFHFNGQHEEKFINASDSIVLSSILFHTDSPKGVIFYLHGNTGGLDKWGKIAIVYTHLGYDIFMMDYRGYGKSEGSIKNEKQLYSDVLYRAHNDQFSGFEGSECQSVKKSPRRLSR